jgi:hypothetical protein
MGSHFFCALYGIYVVTLNELKVILKVSTQAGQSGAVNKTSVETMAKNDNFHEVKRHKRHISNDTLQTSKKSTKPVPTSAAIKLPPKAVLTRNFFAPLRTIDIDTRTTGTRNTLLEQEALGKPGRPPPTMTTCSTHLIRLQSDFKDHVQGGYEF